MLPYSAEVLYALYGHYNQAIWPIQIRFLVLAGVSLALTLNPWRQAGRVVGAILVLAWSWAAIGFHWQHFSLINFSAGILRGAVRDSGLAVRLDMGGPWRDIVPAGP